MFYFIPKAIATYNIILIAAAILPAVFLLFKVYRSDRLERESSQILWSLIRGGVLSSLLALVEERILSLILNMTVPADSIWYNIILYFVIVAFAEETSKYIFLKRRSWRHYEFNCQFDGVVYGVFVSLGFAIWENISYVLTYGFFTAIVRAVTAIPGHACFGIFMGVFYGIARKYENRGDTSTSAFFRFLSVLVPALLHGTYDYIASMDTVNGSTTYFVVFVLALFVVSYLLVNRFSKEDTYI